MPLSDIATYLGMAVTVLGFAGWVLKLTFAIAKRDGALEALAKEVVTLTKRVDEHDDLRVLVARLEQTIDDMRRSLDRIEKKLEVRAA